jgi:NAD(P)-dependent dehydrogenase (short-subunit alcohol dehydrogenase family)
VKTETDCVLITGGTGKLGRIMVAGFVKSGHTVCFTSRSEEKMAELMRGPALAAGPGKAVGVVAELGTAGSAARLAEQVREKGLRPVCLVNNARNVDFLRLDADGSPSLQNWVGEYTLDVVVPYELSMLLAHQADSRLRSIINIASMYGVVAANPVLYEDPRRESPVHYSVAKAALIHLTRELAVRLASRNVRVNSISYGGVSGRAAKDFESRYARLTPSGRMLGEEEIFGAAEFLASDASSGTTGHNLVVDGGWTAW